MSRHRAENGPSCFTVHSTGNWGFDPQRGGNPRELARASATAVAAVFEYFRAHSLEGFQLNLEATHHGPTSLPWPSLFVEVGSGDKEWKDQAACAIVAEAALAACRGYRKTRGRVALGFGGTHYCPKFGELEAREHLFSHVAPGYACDSLDEQLFAQAIRKTVEKVDCAALDWKGLSGEQRKKVIALAEQAGLAWEKA
ncbi:MAG: D-aminoacyl-tRNA deacylase [Candidatus Micrarchaeota archaeon]